MYNKKHKKKPINRRQKPSWQYYGVRLFKRLVVFGEPIPELIDEFYEEESQKQYLEELVLLVRAKSPEHAFEIAEKKTMEYETADWNIYGQRMIWRLVDSIDCFVIYDELKTGAEIYSTFHATNINKKPDDYIDEYYVPHSGCRKGRYGYFDHLTDKQIITTLEKETD